MEERLETKSVAQQATDILGMSALALSDAIHTRQVSCGELMAATLAAIERFNPIVNAIVSLRDGDVLMEEARGADTELAAGRSRGWLHGIPQAIKDLAAAKGIPNTQGSPLFAGIPAPADAIFVERIRAAGAIVVGKTNTPEFGFGSQTYNPVFGPTRNAYDQAKTSGGSSGGAAVGLALRILSVADGSDHAGSLRNPAAFNNVFGFRPSYGRVPGEARDVFTPAMGVAGPMARNIPDLARLLATMSGPDPRVPYSIAEDPSVFAGSLRSDTKGLRIGWLGDLGGHLPFEPGVLELCREALKVFEALGCTVEEAAPGFDPERIWQAWVKLRAFQAGANLKELCADPAKRAQIKPEAIFEVESGAKLTGWDIADASAERTLWHAATLRLFERYDVLVMPSAQVFPFAVETHWPREIAGRAMDTYHRWMEVVIPVTMAGCPSLNVPVGFNAAGLPMGMQLIGPIRGELACLRLAEAYDEATRWVEKRPPPLWLRKEG